MSNSTTNSFGEYCSTNDVISVILDCESKTISYFHNGNEMGSAFNNVNIGDGLYPAVTINRKQKAKINFGKSGFKYPIIFEIYPDLRSFHLKMTKEQSQQLEQIYEKYRGWSFDAKFFSKNIDF